MYIRLEQLDLVLGVEFPTQVTDGVFELSVTHREKVVVDLLKLCLTRLHELRAHFTLPFHQFLNFNHAVLDVECLLWGLLFLALSWLLFPRGFDQLWLGHDW